MSLGDVWRGMGEGSLGRRTPPTFLEPACKLVRAGACASSARRGLRGGLQLSFIRVTRVSLAAP